MTTIPIKSTFEVLDWTESPLDSAGQDKTTSARVKCLYHGDLTGHSEIDYTMVYGADGGASYQGVEVIEAKVGDLSGSLVLEHRGVFSQGRAQTRTKVLRQRCTKDFAGLWGEGEIVSVHNQRYDFSLVLNSR